jgi:phosphoglucomutase
MPAEMLPLACGTSGYRKPTRVFLEHPTAQLFSLATLSVLAQGPRENSAALLLGSDNRFFSTSALEHATSALIANAALFKIKTVFIPVDGVISTPAAAAFIAFVNALPEQTPGEPASKLDLLGSILATASHNPGGPDADFGLKVNVGPSGAPAPVSVTSEVAAESSRIGGAFATTDGLKALVSDVSGELRSPKKGLFPANMLDSATAPFKPYIFTDRATGEAVSVHVVDAPAFYLKFIEPIFDFGAIRRLFARPDFTFSFDGMHGVAGPFARKLFVDTLGAPLSSLRRCNPLSDFGGLHPDPNLTYAADLWDSAKRGEFELGAACDGDADRNMIVGNGVFVNPCDSLAVLADFAATHMPYYAARLRALARSMPTSRALDEVARRHRLKLYEVPTGWKFFANIMDHYDSLAGVPGTVLCGEESFGTSSSHIREKDGLWAVCMWLSLLAHHNADPAAPFVGVGQILDAHWQKYGRNFFTRYDYENVSSDSAAQVFAVLREFLAENPTELAGSAVKVADEFSYTDPFDGSTASSQGVRIELESGVRLIFRLSGTGSSGATIRLYVEQYCAPDSASLSLSSAEVLADAVQIALDLSKIQEFTGRSEPSVIT